MEDRSIDRPYFEVEGPWYRHFVSFTFLVAATCVFYSGDIELGFFHLDDPSYVTNNPHIRGFTGDNVSFVLTQPYFANYSPMHLFSYMLDYGLGGLDPRIYHFSSNLWAGVAAGGVYLLCLVLFGSWVFAFIAGLLFIVHPAHVEAVAWISSRKDLVAVAFTLPAMVAYFNYRRGMLAKTWYALSLVLFTLGIAGKLSVIVVPGILFVFDVFVERRRGWGLFLDKVPYALVAIFFGVRVMMAQPPTRKEFDFFVFGHSTLSSLWLLSGFGDYFLARGRPDVQVFGGLKLAIQLAVPVLFVLPALLSKRIPGTMIALFYCMLLALIPAQVLNFVHPVTDRYLFFPSVAATLLIGWIALTIYRRGSRVVSATTLFGLIFVTAMWGRSALAYLDDWKDPRSVWYTVSGKSHDVTAHLYLGTHYHNEADGLPAAILGDEAGRTKAIALARAVWKDDLRLESLLTEWSTATLGKRTAAFQAELRKRAFEQFQKAIDVKGTRVLPNLYFRLGKLTLENGDFDGAIAEFQHAYDESRKHTSQDVRDELAVRSQYAIGLVHWRNRDYEEALTWVRKAEEEQKRQGNHWVPEITQHRDRLEGLFKSSEGG